MCLNHKRCQAVYEKHNLFMLSPTIAGSPFIERGKGGARHESTNPA